MGILNYESKLDSGETFFIKKYLKSKDTKVIFDVGANIGDYSRIIITEAPNSILYSFEPHPVHFAALSEVAKKYKFQAINVGCGDEKGKTKIYDYRDKNSSGHASLYKNVIEVVHFSPAREYEIEITTIDDFVREHDIKQIDFLKIDTEGHELAVLKGAKEALSNGIIKMIQFEFNDMNIVSRTFFQDFKEVLKGYSLHRMLPDGLVPMKPYLGGRRVHYELFAYQNIVAIRD
jgi:FkbM family methyltransferase